MRKRIDPTGYGIGWKKAKHLLPHYEEFFAPIVGKGIKVLELGVNKGASLLLWRDYFENATIVGVDINLVQIDDPTGRIHFYQGFQQDTALLDDIAKEQAPDGFDIIIDDCSHIGRLARVSFLHLFQNHLKPGGLYAIEDWNAGYIDWWPDGKRYKPRFQKVYEINDRIRDILIDHTLRALNSFPRLTKLTIKILIGSKINSHTYGMVGFVKELLDICHFGVIDEVSSGNGRYKQYSIERIHVFASMVMILKSPNPSPTIAQNQGINME